MIEFQNLVFFESLEKFKDYYLPLYNADRRERHLPEVKDEQEIIDLYLDKLNEWKKQTK